MTEALAELALILAHRPFDLLAKTYALRNGLTMHNYGLAKSDSNGKLYRFFRVIALTVFISSCFIDKIRMTSLDSQVIIRMGKQVYGLLVSSCRWSAKE